MDNNQIQSAASPRKPSNDMLKQGLGYIIAAFGLIAGLAWNDAVKSLIEFFLPISNNTIFAKFLYAIIITLIVVKISSSLSRIANTEK